MQEFMKDEIDEIVSTKGNNTLTKLNNLYNKYKQHPYILFRTAKYRYDNGLKNAAKEFRKIAESEDNEYSVPAYYYLIKISLKAGNYKQASKDYEKIKDAKNEYLELLKPQLSEILFRSGRINELLTYYNRLDVLNEVTDQDCYFAFRAYALNHNYSQAIKAIKRAISINPNNSDYHRAMIEVYCENRMYVPLLKEIENLLSQGIKLDDEEQLKLAIPEIYDKMKSFKEAIVALEKNEAEGITRKSQDQLYFNLLTKVCDFYGAEQVSKKIVGYSSESLENYLQLTRMYNRLNLCDKSLTIFNEIEESKPNSMFFKYYKILTLIQLGEYEETINMIYSILDRYPNESRFNTILALCLYLDGDKNAAKSIMNKVPESDGSKKDVFLRKELNLNNSSKKQEDDLYYEMLYGYDFDKVYRVNRRRLCQNNHASGLKKEVNVGRFLSELNSMINDLEPSYKMETDTYLIKYGEDVGYVNNKQTQYFMVDAIPGGQLYTVKPVIPTLEAKKNFQRTRFY